MNGQQVYNLALEISPSVELELRIIRETIEDKLVPFRAWGVLFRCPTSLHRLSEF